MIFTDDILDKHLRIVLDSHFHGWKDCGDIYKRLRCNVCGDGDPKNGKKRAVILKSRTPWMYYCYNEGCSMPVKAWMKYYFNSYYNDYVKEIFKLERVSRLGNDMANPIIQNNVDIEKPVYDEQNDVRHFKSIFSSHMPIFETARQYCKNRLIPYGVWSKWYVSVGGFFKNRLVIPYYDNDGKIYHYQCRDLIGDSKYKYLSRLISNDDSVYNLYNINRNKPVVYLEGAIDSLFIENAVAGSGLKVGDEKFKDLNMYFLLDNDKTGRIKSQKLLKTGSMVFLWKKWMKSLGIPIDIEKDDINKIIIKLNTCGNTKAMFSFKELQPFFTNKQYDKIYLV
jgi:hypothetical protein